MIYVDDLGLFATLKEEITQLKGELKNYFTMTDLDEMKKILGIQVIRDCKAGTLKNCTKCIYYFHTSIWLM